MAEAKIFGAISLIHVVLAVRLGSRGPLQRASQGFCYDNNLPEFCKLIRHFEFEILIWSTLLIWKQLLFLVKT